MTVLPRVSILIPTYKQENCVSTAISSALAQTYPNIEVIVIDDASPDRTDEQVAAFRDPRLRYFRNSRNLGRVHNYRHALYDLATGEWAVNLDGDDYFTDPDFIGKAVKLACSDPGIVIVSAQIRVATPAGVTEPSPREKAVISGKDALLRYHDSRYHLPHLSTLYHRPSALACDFYRMDVISSDWESLLRLALQGKVAYLDVIAGCWNLLGNNASHSKRWKDLSDNLNIWESVYQTALAAGIPRKSLKRARDKNLLSIAFRDLCQLFKGGAVADAFKYLYRGYPVFKLRVALNILVHPYIWGKCALNIVWRMGQRIF